MTIKEKWERYGVSEVTTTKELHGIRVIINTDITMAGNPRIKTLKNFIAEMYELEVKVRWRILGKTDTG